MDVVESPRVRAIALVALLVVMAAPFVLARPPVRPLALATGVALGALAVVPPVSRRLRRSLGGGDSSDREYPWYYHAGVGVGGAVGGQAVGRLLPAGLLLALLWAGVGALGTAAVGLLVRAVI